MNRAVLLMTRQIAAGALSLALHGASAPPAIAGFPASESIPLLSPLSGRLAVGDVAGTGEMAIAYDGGNHLVILENLANGWQEVGDFPIGPTSAARRNVRFYEFSGGPLGVEPGWFFFTSSASQISVARKMSGWSVDAVLGPFTGTVMGFSSPAILAGPSPYGYGWRLAVSRNNYESGSDQARVFLAEVATPSDLYVSPPLNSSFPIGLPLTGDFDGNGFQDVAMLSQGSNLLVDYATVSGGFGGWSTVALSGIVLDQFGAAGQLDNLDSLSDLVFIGANDALYLLRSTGTGFTRTPYLGPRFGMPLSVLRDMAIGDLNGDGAADVVTLYNDGGFVWMNDGTGTLGTPNPFPTPGGVSCAIADVDRDGLKDIVVGRTNSIEIYHGGGDGSLGPPRGVPLANPINYGMAVLNLDGALPLDVVVAGEDPSFPLEVLLSDGLGSLASHGGFAGAGTEGYFIAPIWGPYYSSPGGVATAQGGSGSSAVELSGNNSGDLVFNASLGFAGALPVGALAVGDFDLDIAPDFAAAMGSSPATIEVLNSTEGATSAPCPDDPVGLLAAFIDALPGPDLVVACAGGEVYPLMGDGFGIFTPATGFSTTHPFPASPGRSHLLALMDVPPAKLLLAATADGYLLTSVVDPSGNLATPVEIPVGETCSGVSVGDLDGDLLDDVAVSGTFNIAGIPGTAGVRVFYGNGTGGFTGSRTLFTTDAVDAADVQIAEVTGIAPKDLLLLLGDFAAPAAPLGPTASRAARRGIGPGGTLGVLPGDDPAPTTSVPGGKDAAPGALSVSVSPNPAPAGTRIAFALPTASRVSLSIVDIAGRRVASILDTEQGAGRAEVRWDGRDLAGGRVRPGLYFVRLEAGGRTGSARIAVTR